MEQEPKKVIGRENLSLTKCELLEDGFWKVISEVHDKVLYEGESEWVEEIVDAMAMDTDPQKGIQTAMNSTLGYLLQNVYQNGFNGLIEYREYERKLNASKIEGAENS